MEQSPSSTRTVAERGFRPWAHLRQWLGALTQFSARHPNGGSQVNGNPAPPKGGEDETPEEKRAQERAANQAAFARRFPAPYVLGPQAYSDPSVWRPDGVDEPLTLNKQYGDTMAWLAEMDAIVDSNPDQGEQSAP